MEGKSYAQAEHMENEAMARNLDAQARAIWPQERPILARLLSGPPVDLLDVGCGTGEISSRISDEFAPRRVVGIDLSELNLQRARAKFPPDRYPRITFRQGDGTALPFPNGEFDIAICRHMLQAAPNPNGVIGEMVRVVKPKGWVYFLAEDYGMIFFHPTKYDTDEFFRDFGWKSAEKTGSNLRQGRTMPSVLHGLGCTEIRMEYLTIDTLRVDRNLLGDIFMHWRDGYVDFIALHAGIAASLVRERFDDMIACTRSPEGYAAWLIPCVSAKVRG